MGILIVLFGALLIAEIVEFFVHSEEFDGIMMCVRPVVVVVLVLLAGRNIWSSLFYGLLWGFLGFALHIVVAVMIEEHTDEKKCKDNESIEQLLEELRKTTKQPESQPNQPFDDLPSQMITELSEQIKPKTKRTVPLDTPPSKITSTTPLDVPPPKTDIFDI